MEQSLSTQAMIGLTCKLKGLRSRLQILVCTLAPCKYANSQGYTHCTFINKITFYFHYLVDKTVKKIVPDPHACECVAEDRLHENAQVTCMFSATKLTKMAKSMCVTL